MAHIKQGSNVVATAGKGLQYCIPLVFAYSGNISVSSAVTTMLDFETGNKPIQGRFQVFEDGASDDDFEILITINNIEVVAFKYIVPYKLNEQVSELHFTMPPLSKVVVSLARTSGSGSQTWNAMFNGRIYNE